MENGYTKRQVADWRAYEKVRKGGQWNMWDEDAKRASGLRREDYLFVLRNYSELKELAQRRSDERIRKQLKQLAILSQEAHCRSACRRANRVIGKTGTVDLGTNPKKK